MVRSGSGSSKPYDPGFHVPGSMQIVGPTLNGTARWLSKLIKDAITYFRDDNGNSLCLCPVLYCYGSSYQAMFTRMQQDTCEISQRNTKRVSPEHPSLLVLDDLMSESIYSEQVMDFSSQSLCYCGHSKPVCHWQTQHRSESQILV